ncbi:MAG: hypothetical protein ABSH49_04340 [Bryobacteraceae bacterium]
MSARTEPASSQEALPKIMKFCKACQMETAHQIRRGVGATATICIPCLYRALRYELDRD